MKRLLTVCITLFIAVTTSLASKTDIKLKKKDEAGTRSISVEFTASHDNNTIYISSNKTKDIKIIVTDLSGNVIYANMISISVGQLYSFILNSVEDRKYKIELSDDKTCWSGFFSIDSQSEQYNFNIE